TKDQPGSGPGWMMESGSVLVLALDLGRPGLLDLLDHRVRHRDVVEILGHLGALLESELKNLIASCDDALSVASLCIRMKVEATIGQDFSPGWSVRIR